jgi:hypothetical protein
MSQSKQHRLTIRTDKDTVENLDDLIWRAKVAGVLDRDTNRSDLLRDKIDDLIEELESEIEDAEDE